MTSPDWSSPRTIAVAAGVVLALGAGVWAWSARSDRTRTVSTLPKELQLETLQAKASGPGGLAEMFRGGFRRDDLTEAQRRELRGNVRQVFRKALKDRMEEYFNAPPDQKDSVLDAQIDQFQEQMERFRQQRREAERRRAEGRNDQERMRQRFRQRSQDERKASSESRNPDDTARMMVYFSAVRSRAAQRGITMPGRGFGGRGGGGAGGSRGGRRP